MVISALYVGGARDLLLTLSGNQGYFAGQGYGSAQIAYFTDYPVFFAISWVINIAAGLTAPVALLLRRRAAAPLAFSGSGTDAADGRDVHPS